MADVTFSVNGQSIRIPDTLQSMHLLDYLHEEMGLTGTKFCCGIGVCQACTVAVQRETAGPLLPMVTCITPLSAVQGMHIHTVENVVQGGKLHPIQQAFLDGFAFQCGYCTPGFVMASLVLWDKLKRKPVARDKLDDAIHGAIGNHICRCTGYVRYYESLRKVILSQPDMTTD